ncbi:hypothetical protein D3C87_1808910 [compost metagenome]
MMRVPSEISLEWLVGQREPDELAKSFHELPSPEVDRLIRRCAAALQSHGDDFQRGRDKDNALVAFETTMAVLLEVRDLLPNKRADIDPILVRFGYPVPEN